MRWTDIADVPCSIARSLSVVGDRWTLLILRDTFLGVRRFDVFQRNLGIARHVLADRLRKLTEAGMLEKRRYQDKPPRHEYRLTEKGRDFYPVIVSLTAWGDKWMPMPKGKPVELFHKTCGEQITPQLSCPSCGEHVRAVDMRAQPGPGLLA